MNFYKKKENEWNATAHNERFAKMAGVFPLKNLCELATPCPAYSSVEAATTQNRHHVRCRL